MIEHLCDDGFSAARSMMPLIPAALAGDFVSISGGVPTSEPQAKG